MKKTIWFLRGYSNLYHAFNDIKKEDINNEFNILSTHVNPNFVGFESADFSEVEPEFTDELEFIEYCKAMIVKYSVDIIFPTHKQKILSLYREELEALGTKLITCVDHNFIDVINNKASLYTYIENIEGCPVKIPAYYTIDNKEDFLKFFTKMNNENQLACIKPTVGVYGEGFYFISKNNKFVKSMLEKNKLGHKKYKKIIQQEPHQLILMEYLEGDERSVDCVAINGKLVAGVIRTKNSGEKFQTIENNPDLMKQVKWLTKNLSLNGMFNIQFRDKNNEHYLLEINPRLSGGSATATQVGFNIPYIATVLFTKTKKLKDINIDIQTNVKVYSLATPIVLHNSKG